MDIGSRWVVGNGESVNIWEDRWIPTSDSFKVVSLRVFMDPEKVLACLLDKDTRSWDVDKVRSTFLPHEANSYSSSFVG